MSFLITIFSLLPQGFTLSNFQVDCMYPKLLLTFVLAGLSSSVILGKNNKYLTALSTWLKPVVQSKSSSWKRCWRASVDGWAASTFHSRCDGKGPTVTIIKVQQYIFGGYTSTSWSKFLSYFHFHFNLPIYL